jgi:hypothetical protein
VQKAEMLWKIAFQTGLSTPEFLKKKYKKPPPIASQIIVYRTACSVSFLNVYSSVSKKSSFWKTRIFL